MAWLRYIGGRIKSDYRYSVGLVLNTFPWPEATAQQKGRITTFAQRILDVRANHSSSTLADLYDPDVMPAPLRTAHRGLDDAVDKLYRGGAFGSDGDRVAYLFTLYEKLVAPLVVAAYQPKGRRSRKRAT